MVFFLAKISISLFAIVIQRNIQGRKAVDNVFEIFITNNMICLLFGLFARLYARNDRRGVSSILGMY
jgi:multisubunit Na+/H+ antiporter MnhF subunit